MRVLTEQDKKRLGVKEPAKEVAPPEPKPMPAPTPAPVVQTGDSTAVIALARAMMQVAGRLEKGAELTTELLVATSQPTLKKRAKFTILRDERGLLKSVMMEEL